MRRQILALSLLACSGPAMACGSLTHAQNAAALAADVTAQEAMVDEFITAADQILVGTVARLSGDSAIITVDSHLKGNGPQTATVQPAAHLHAIGCMPSSHMRNFNLAEGRTYVFYLAADTVLRAGELQRNDESLSAADEIGRVRAHVD